MRSDKGSDSLKAPIAEGRIRGEVVSVKNDGRAVLRGPTGKLYAFGLESVVGYGGEPVEQFGLKPGAELEFELDPLASAPEVVVILGGPRVVRRAPTSTPRTVVFSVSPIPAPKAAEGVVRVVGEPGKGKNGE